MSGEYTRAIRNHYIEGRAAHAECSARLIRMASMWAGGDVCAGIQVPGKARTATLGRLAQWLKSTFGRFNL